MKYCPNCGNQLSDEALFCEYCGAKQPVVHQSEPQPMPQSMPQSMPDSAMVQSQISMGTELKTEKASKKKKGSKKPLIITLVILLVAALGVGGFFLFKNIFKSEQEKLLDRYFEAINNRDKDAIYGVEYDFDEGKKTPNDYVLYKQDLGFIPGLISNSDYLATDQDIMYEYLKGLGYSGENYGEIITNYREDCRDNGDILLSDFKASYELEDLKKAEDCKVGYYKNGLTFVDVDDVEKYIEDKKGIDVSDVYIAKFKIYWEYNGHKYGNDEKLMDIIKEKNKTTSYDIYDMNDELDDMDYYMIFYKYDGKCYMLDYRVRKWSYSWRIEM